MLTVKPCLVCLRTDVKVFNMNAGQLRHEYNLVSGIMTHTGNGLPEYLCYHCAAYVRNFTKFRDKCQRTYLALQEILDQDKKITDSLIEELNSNSLKIEPILSYLQADHKWSKYENSKHKGSKQNFVDVEQPDNLSIIHYDTTTECATYEVSHKKPKLWIESEDINIKQEEDLIENNFQSFTNDTEVSKLDTNDDSFFDNTFDDYDDQMELDGDKIDIPNDCTALEEDYAHVVPITIKESKAVIEVNKLMSQAKCPCTVCGKSYNSEERLKDHMRMHDMNINGTWFCTICKYYYRSELLLKIHNTEKHMYKYICKKCPEVNFDRHAAKRHYYWGHFQEISKKNTNIKRKNKKNKGPPKHKSAIRRLGAKLETPEDFPKKTAITQEEQYSMVRERQLTKNYMDSPYKCDHCFKGFRASSTFKTHLKKHDPVSSGIYQCDACKIYYPTTAKMYKHMTRCHIFKYTCPLCGYICYNRGQAKVHFRWHKKVIYPCPHCNKEFSKESTKLGHIRKMHPSTNICSICGHSFVSVAGLHLHKLKAHTKQEMEQCESVPDTSHPLYCAECGVQFRDEDAYTRHLSSSNKHALTNRAITKVVCDGESEALTDKGVVNMGRATASNCEICNKYLQNDTQAMRHYDAEHPGAPYLKRYMCDICGHKTRQYANLVVHLRTHTQEKPYACPHCDRRFSMQNNRDRHLVVHTGEKRFQCPHCHRRFSQKNTVKLHVQTVHMKIPYPPWNKKNRKPRREIESAPVSPAPYKMPHDSAHGNYLSAYIDTTNKVCGAN